MNFWPRFLTTTKRNRGLKIAFVVGVATLTLTLGLALWASVVAIGWLSNQAPVAWETLTSQAPEVRKRFEGVMPNLSQVLQNWLPARAPDQREVPGEDVGGVARYEGLVRVRYAEENGSRTVVYEGRGRLRPVADHYRARFLEKGWPRRMLYATPDEERHQYQSGDVPITLQVKHADGMVRVEIAESPWAVPDAAAGDHGQKE